MKKILLTLAVPCVFFAVRPVMGSEGSDSVILAPGNPPLTNGMVRQLSDAFAWLLNGSFTEAQRGEFARLLAGSWRTATPAAIDGYVKLLEAQPQLAQLAPGQREQTRQKLEATIVESLKQQSNEPLAHLLLAVHEGGSSNVAAGDPTHGPAPAALVGTWGTGSMSSTTFRDSRTGAYSAPSGTQVQYKFLPDGRYEYAALTTQSMYNCTTKLMTYKTGVVAYQGDGLVFIPQSGKFTSEDNCNARFNYEKPVGLERESYGWRVERDEYGVKMCLKNDTINGCAYRH